MWPSYSPLFTSGLLAETSSSSSHDDHTSTIYFTLRKRDKLRSFLSLDLADGRRHKRKASTLTKSTSWTCTADAKSCYDFTRTEKPVITIPPVVPARRRTSKESLRNIPSPKPAPSSTLPDLPVTPNSRFPPTSVSDSSSKESPTSPADSPLALTPRLQRAASLRSESISSHDRQKGRMDALACLEGHAPHRIRRSVSLQNNFMSFSDDEDDTLSACVPFASATPVSPTEDLSSYADVEDEVDAIIPTVTRKREAVDRAKPVRPSRAGRRRRSTIESWFPLRSFIDLKDDDLSWNWRSFIEIGGVA